MKQLYAPIIGLLMLCINPALQAQEDTTKIWKYSGAATATFSNVVLENWAGGGQNSVSIGNIFDFKAVRTTDKSTWTNTANLAFGIARLGGEGNLFKKTDDQIVLGSSYNYNFSEKWSINGGVELRTQFAPGYTFDFDADGNEFRDQTQSDFFAPAFLNTNLGINYKDKIFTLTISPVSNKLTFVLDDSLSNAGAFGVDPGDKLRSEVGPSFIGKMEISPIKNVTFKSSILLFANYQTLDRIDVDWETLLVLTVNKYITTSFGTRLIYDHDILIPQSDGVSRQAVQYKQALTVNVGIKF